MITQLIAQFVTIHSEFNFDFAIKSDEFLGDFQDKINNLEQLFYFPQDFLNKTMDQKMHRYMQRI